jgi:hypothetical protein
MSRAAVNAIIDEIYGAREGYYYGEYKTLDIGGTNAAPGAAAMAQIVELEADYSWLIDCTGC